jgi:hypothetical protein
MIKKTLTEHKTALSFEQNNIFDAVVAFLDASIDAEVDRAISYSIDESKRTHACGRAEALKDFKDLLYIQNDEAKNGKFKT